MNQRAVNVVSALLHGFTGAGLFRKLDYPRAPDEFIDSRPLDEINASGEIESTFASYLKDKQLVPVRSKND